ncbi:MAG: Ig-like domain-containing protein, partial [Anaerolineae bacterium]|nr:Ig-like domain-containing protein [Anaerolineae bacterium]
MHRKDLGVWAQAIRSRARIGFVVLLILGLAPWLWQIGQAQAVPTTLAPGDIAIIGLNFDDPDEFAFVLLRAVGSGTVINFTDNGWFAAGGFRTGEGTLTWTAATDLAAGTVISPGAGTMLFSVSGDQILAYQGPAASPTFIYGLNNEGAAVWQAEATSSNTSALPTGLVNGTTAVALNEIDNAVYVGPTSGTQAALLAAISNPANWAGSNTVRQTMPTGPFTIITTDVPPTATSPLDSATNVPLNSDIAINFSEPVTVTAPWFTIACSVSGGHSAVVSGGPQSYTLNPDADFAYGDTCTVTVLAAQVVDQDGTPTPMAADYVFSFSTPAVDPCSDVYTPIYAIQGSGMTAALLGPVVTEGLVVGDYQDTTTQLRGFYIQDLTGDANSATSDGIFVFDNGFGVDVAVGDEVRVTGSATEYTSGSSSLTEIGSVSQVLICGTAPVAPASVTLPLAAATDWERYEGMAVIIAQELTVSENYDLHRYGQLTLSQGGRLFQPTNVAAPGAPALAVQDDNNKRSIVLDDASNLTLPPTRPVPYLAADNTIRTGDTTPSLQGV